ncbi:hypothetical protein [Frankia sp. AgB32]|uniref:hypothetical protein n=1 Tax=Frankia sp. AgB32 TaxID=631119 RepID=UPI00200DB12E|nr:hypothetical protein [Frankia sp. AgB32]
MALVSRTTERLMARVDSAVGTADRKVLLHPGASPAVVRSGNEVAVAVADFHARVGIESGRRSLEARRWVDAAAVDRAKTMVAPTCSGGRG